MGPGVVVPKFLAGYMDSPILGLSPMQADFESTNNGHLRPNVTLMKDPQGVDTYTVPLGLKTVIRESESLNRQQKWGLVMRELAQEGCVDRDTINLCLVQTVPEPQSHTALNCYKCDS